MSENAGWLMTRVLVSRSTGRRKCGKGRCLAPGTASHDRAIWPMALPQVRIEKRNRGSTRPGLTADLEDSACGKRKRSLNQTSQEGDKSENVIRAIQSAGLLSAPRYAPGGRLDRSTASERRGKEKD